MRLGGGLRVQQSAVLARCWWLLVQGGVVALVGTCRALEPPTILTTALRRFSPLGAGLPEEVAHTKQCLARGYAVLALMSKDRLYRSRCFSSSSNTTLSELAHGRAGGVSEHFEEGGQGAGTTAAGTAPA